MKEEKVEDEEEEDEDLRASVQDSILEVDDSESDENSGEEVDTGKEIEENDDDEGIDEGSYDDTEEYDNESGNRVKSSEVPPASLDDLNANFIIEKVVVESSDDESITMAYENEDQNITPKRRGFSMDQIQLETKKGKDSRGRGIFKDRGRKGGGEKFTKKKGRNLNGVVLKVRKNRVKVKKRATEEIEVKGSRSAGKSKRSFKSMV